MITSRFPLGDVSFSAEYFSTLGRSSKQCYGVAAWPPCDLTDDVSAGAVRGDDSARASVSQEGGTVSSIELQYCHQLRAEHLHQPRDPSRTA